jgi:hypothetical protein
LFFRARRFLVPHFAGVLFLFFPSLTLEIKAVLLDRSVRRVPGLVTMTYAALGDDDARERFQSWCGGKAYLASDLQRVCEQRSRRWGKIQQLPQIVDL